MASLDDVSSSSSTKESDETGERNHDCIIQKRNGEEGYAIESCSKPLPVGCSEIKKCSRFGLLKDVYGKGVVKAVCDKDVVTHLFIDVDKLNSDIEAVGGF